MTEKAAATSPVVRVERISDLTGCDAVCELRWTGESARRFNLVYGWNGSGKTTLSRLFRLLENASGLPPGFESVTARAHTADGKFNIAAGTSPPCDVRVFNEHFRDEYVAFRTARAEPIVVLGKENIQVGPRIESIESELRAAERTSKEADAEVETLPDLSVILRDAARVVSEELSQRPALRTDYDPRRYQAPKIRSLIDDGHLSEGNLSSVVIDDSSELASLKQQVDSELGEIRISTVPISDLDEVFATANRLLALVVDVPAIERLDSDVELRRWVGTGFELHKSRSAETCQYCTNAVPAGVTRDYEAYFTEVVDEAERELVATRVQLDRVKELSGKPFPDSTTLFSDLRDEYGHLIARIESAWEVVSSSISEAVERLNRRAGGFQDRGSSEDPVAPPSSEVERFNQALARVGELLNEHNRRIEEGHSTAKEIGRRLELHLAASELRKAAYFEKARQAEGVGSRAESAAKEVERLSGELQDLRAQRSDTGAACQDINRLIELFLGKGEIELVPVEQEDATTEYHLLRRNRRTPHLSEGEKTIVALSYFLTKLTESGADVARSIVVLDDPVDSQDANFLYRTFALLRHRLSEAGQVFVLTHNFEFFNLVRDWLGYDGVRDSARIFMMRASPGPDGGGQVTHVEDLPRILSDFRTEYQYLMSLLLKFDDGQEGLEAPLVPNVARKVLEYFSSFKWSCPSSMSMASIVNNYFLPDAKERRRGVGEAVLRFVNEYSHGGRFDRPVTASQFEAPAVAKMTLDFIRFADGDHYKLLKRQVARRG